MTQNQAERRFSKLAAAIKEIGLLPGPCVEWCWATTRGYGRVWRDGELYYVHREAWRLAVGAIPDGLDVLHRCDNPPCYRPKHLFIGTRGDNNRDTAQKGRHGMAKLTPGLVREIRTSSESSYVLAARLGVNATTVQRARRGAWSHV